MRMWGAAAAAIAIVVGAACGGGSKADPPAATTVTPTTAVTPKSTVRVTTTTKPAAPPPPYSFDNSVPPPALVNTGSARTAVVQSLIEYSDWLAAHRPDAALTSNVAAEGSRSFEKISNNMRELTANDRRLYEVKSAPDEISIVSSTPTAMTAKIVQHLTAQRVVDRSGRVRIERPVSDPVTYIGLFVRDGEAWLLAALDDET